MATYQLYNDTESVKLIEGGVTHTLDKSYSLYVLGECVHIYYQRKDAPAWVINFMQVDSVNGVTPATDEELIDLIINIIQ